ncbi:MAG: hypothetical protein UU42_C0004G0023 [Candidatus Woesebacteria bacterium GW2011_GWA1_41_13b]|uniref:Uncharacterized protein n=1 Tax=Candidatus Woesebacteria bacterium GW2011_GWA1_41_13b TaxID=1618555 RepID=A0A0G0XW39_9BACT|nr:MAG: hypothetical protein UU42_C0004G0023 [Candidatus Woesebacteria bacterium GW2011_GWA1_41_13b]
MKKLAPYLVLGLILRLFLIPISLHPDLRAPYLAGYLITKGEVFTFYDHISKLPRDHKWVQVYGDGQFNYPPLAYLVHGLYLKIVSPIFPWNAFWHLIDDIGSLRTDPGFASLMYFLKAPYLIADILGLLILRKIVDAKHRFAASLLWIFNPVNLYASYLVGQQDIFIVLFILLAYLKQSGIFLGIAAAFKPFPLLLLPFLGTTWRQKITAVITGLITYAVIISPYLNSTGFKHYALLATQSDKPFYAKVMVSGSQYLPLFVVGLGFLFWLKLGKSDLLSPLLIFFAVTHFHPQWFVWASPLLILRLIKDRASWLPVTVLLVSYFLIILSFDPSLNFGLVGITYSLQWLLTDATISLVRGVFAATALYLILK